MFQSETYELYDVIKYDNATTLDHTDNFWTSASNITRGDEYSTIDNLVLYSLISGDVFIELDMKTTMTSAGQLLFIATDSSSIRPLTVSECGLTQNTWGHVKLKIADNKLSVVGGSVSDVDVTGYKRFRVRASSENQTYFKNVKIYSA